LNDLAQAAFSHAFGRMRRDFAAHFLRATNSPNPAIVSKIVLITEQTRNSPIEVRGQCTMQAGIYEKGANGCA
jgi:hypothetical protein